MDVMMDLHNALTADTYIKEQTGYTNKGKTNFRIKFFEYPETGNLAGPYIIIDSLTPPLDSDYGDDEPITEEYLYQVDVWTKDRNVTKELARRVKKVLRANGFYYFAGGVDEYDPDTKIFRDARRFRGKVYTEEFRDAQ
jgi:hypothetical protein